MKPFNLLLFVFVFLLLSALSLGCGGSGRADGDTGTEGDTETADGDVDAETEGDVTVDGDTETDGYLDSETDGETDIDSDGDADADHECPSVFDLCEFVQRDCRANDVWECQIVLDEYGCPVGAEGRLGEECADRTCVEYGRYNCGWADDAKCVDPAGPYCDSASSQEVSADTDSARLACVLLDGQYLDPNLLCGNGDALHLPCLPVSVDFGRSGAAVICEMGHPAGDRLQTPSWLGPGYGCVWGDDSAQVITGWYTGVGGTGDPCHDKWTAESIARVLKRSPPDPTPCETITDYETCLATHNHPYHCMAVYGWPIEQSGNDCLVRGHLDRHGDELEEARFIGCRTVREPFNHLDNLGWPPHPIYQGPLMNTGSGECVGFADLELAIPAGWEKVLCWECQQPVDGDEAEEEPAIPLVCGGGICSDPVTGYQWQQASMDGALVWEDAVAHCQNLILDGTGWRLPNINELRSLVRHCQPIESGGACGVVDRDSTGGIGWACLAPSCWTHENCYPPSCTDTGGPTGCYRPTELVGWCTATWSSSSVVSSYPGWAWVVDFRAGEVNQHTKNVDHAVRCVRTSVPADGDGEVE